MPDIAVVVVAYRSASTLADCLTSLLADPNARVTVVDNSGDARTRDLCAHVAATYPDRLTYDDPGLNLGYAKACNRGLAALAPRDLVAIVNPDVFLGRTLSELAALPEFRRGDMIAGRLRSPDSESALNARPGVSIAREIGKALVGTRAYRETALIVPDGHVHEVEQLDGALLLLQAGTWQDLGGFDERFELYYEDVDLCARVRRTGRCLLANSPWGAHIGGHSFRGSNGRAFVALRVSRTRYAMKWWRPLALARSSALLIAAVEWLTRSVTRQAEGKATRALAFRRVVEELRDAGSQHVLAQPGSDG
jgi:N-acetylglucosaminyl-diphospho-decaprenol L-rhamnosyltransferase